jgi:hypothetical protein
MGADPDASDVSDGSEESSDEDEDEDGDVVKPARVVVVSHQDAEVEAEEKERKRVQKEHERIQKEREKGKQQKKKEATYEVGDFVTAVYEGQWLIAQVDINQDHAGTTHVNLNYMERISDNQFRWPKHDDRLLTLKEDILTTVSDLVLVGSSIRANHVGLKASEAQAADAALAAMVYLQQFYFLKLLAQNFLHFTYFCSLISTHSSILIIKTKSQIMFPNFNTSIF